MNFPLPGRKTLMALHRQIYYKLGPAAADVLASLAQELKDASDESEMWRDRAVELQDKHGLSSTEQNRIYQDKLKDRYSKGKSKNE